MELQAIRHFMLDAYECEFDPANNVMEVNDLLISLASELKMKPVMPPSILPYYYCDEVEDGGISAFMLCQGGSHITVHTFPHRYCYFIDVLTENFFEEERAKEIVGRHIPAKNMQCVVADRRDEEERGFDMDTTRDFGPHYMIKINNLDATMESIFHWLDHIAPQINMLPISRPYVIFDRIENPNYISGILVVAQSHIAFHYGIAERAAHIDIFSCSFLDDGVVRNILRQPFGEDINIRLFTRGSKHQGNLQVQDEKRRNYNSLNRSWRGNL